MFKIVSAGKIVALCDRPRYIAKNPENGALVKAEGPESAEGLAVAGTVYRLGESESFPDAPEAVISEVEGGEMIFSTMAQVDTVNATNGIAFVAMAEAGTIDDVTAGEHAELFSPWAYPVTYTEGQLRKYGGKLYRCISGHTSQVDWTPDVSVSLWKEAADPAEEWPEWSQPLGAHDAYGAGDKVSHNGQHWTSNQDGNVWEPGVFGWTKADTE